MSAIIDEVYAHGDLRGASKDRKREKDSKVKWSHGARPGYGSRLVGGEVMGGTEGQQAAIRPSKEIIFPLS